MQTGAFSDLSCRYKAHEDVFRLRGDALGFRHVDHWRGASRVSDPVRGRNSSQNSADILKGRDLRLIKGRAQAPGGIPLLMISAEMTGKAVPI